ncbi:MAG: hypothetical protein OXP74_04965 [Acidobacteriota bacterium]|nr:hypothetical protein [Acidobacteriota bacterium]
MSTTYYSSDSTMVRRGEVEVSVYEEDGHWVTEFRGEKTPWPTRAEAEEEAHNLIRQHAGPNAVREGAEFGET